MLACAVTRSRGRPAHATYTRRTFGARGLGPGCGREDGSRCRTQLPLCTDGNTVCMRLPTHVASHTFVSQRWDASFKHAYQCPQGTAPSPVRRRLIWPHAPMSTIHAAAERAVGSPPSHHPAHNPQPTWVDAAGFSLSCCEAKICNTEKYDRAAVTVRQLQTRRSRTTNRMHARQGLSACAQQR